MIYLHKILPLAASPIGLLIFLIVYGLIFRSRRASLLALLVIWICSMPSVSNKLVNILENDFQLTAIEKVEKAGAVVVLSGMVKAVQGTDGLIFEWGEASDRIFAGIELIKANKAPTLILTRGLLPWSVGIPEGEFLSLEAQRRGINELNIKLTKAVENTEQEAAAIKELLEGSTNKIILVTSAFHMPRAIKVFRAKGIDVIPYAVDFRYSLSKATPMDYLPDADALKDTSFFVREMIGRLYYSIKY